jgi:hypothetical protein
MYWLHLVLLRIGLIPSYLYVDMFFLDIKMKQSYLDTFGRVGNKLMQMYWLHL